MAHHRKSFTGQDEFSELDQRLLNDFQHGFPLTPKPYADIARQVGVSEEIVLERLQSLKANGVVSRVGPVFQPNRIGASTLAAMAVPAEQLEETAAIVSAHPAVNHNYERLHRYNLWFVVTAQDSDAVRSVLAELEHATGIEVMDLPMIEDYFIDLGFDLKWT